DQAKIDRYLIALSAAAGRDVRPYFAHFKMYPSSGTVVYMDSLNLPKWDMTYWVQPKETSTPKNTPLAIPCSKAELLSFAKESRILWRPATAQGGKVEYRDKGEAVYTPAPGFSGVDTLTYELSNEYGTTAKKTLRIKVD
ncbi:MAG: Ig-like domain-containing protein, partial [Akkermansia sp.]|nr:Ig-like domain-containing protein [Akkermansia sp.]